MEFQDNQKYYTAEELGEMFGVSAEKIDEIAEANGLKPPFGESNEYGRWIMNPALLTSRERQVLKDSLLKFALRVSTYGEPRFQHEIAILPAIAELLLRM